MRVCYSDLGEHKEFHIIPDGRGDRKCMTALFGYLSKCEGDVIQSICPCVAGDSVDMTLRRVPKGKDNESLRYSEQAVLEALAHLVPKAGTALYWIEDSGKYLGTIRSGSVGGVIKVEDFNAIYVSMESGSDECYVPLHILSPSLGNAVDIWQENRRKAETIK